MVSAHDEVQASSVVPSAVEKDRETRHLQLLKNPEIMLRDSHIGNEGTGYGFEG